VGEITRRSEALKIGGITAEVRGVSQSQSPHHLGCAVGLHLSR